MIDLGAIKLPARVKEVTASFTITWHDSPTGCSQDVKFLVNPTDTDDEIRRTAFNKIISDKSIPCGEHVKLQNISVSPIVLIDRDFTRVVELSEVSSMIEYIKQLVKIKDKLFFKDMTSISMYCGGLHVDMIAEGSIYIKYDEYIKYLFKYSYKGTNLIFTGVEIKTLRGRNNIWFSAELYPEVVATVAELALMMYPKLFPHVLDAIALL